MSVAIKIRWRDRVGHVKGYDSNKVLIYEESFTAPTRKAFRAKVQEKLQEYAVVEKRSIDIA